MQTFAILALTKLYYLVPSVIVPTQSITNSDSLNNQNVTRITLHLNRVLLSCFARHLAADLDRLARARCRSQKECSAERYGRYGKSNAF